MKVPQPTSARLHAYFAGLAALLLMCASLSSTATAQREWRTEEISTVGMKFSINRRLERLPMLLGQGNDPYLRARMEPQDRGDMIAGRFNWGCVIMEFDKNPEKPVSDEDLEGMSEEQRKLMEQLREIMNSGAIEIHKDFKSWMEDQGSVQLLVDGKSRSGGRSKPAYQEYVWLRAGRGRNQPTIYNAASVYDFEDRQVAVHVYMPLEKEKAKKPKSKWAAIVKRILKSGQTVEVDEDADVDKSRDKFADTPEKLAALEKAKENIANLKGWDYFTTPNYIVVYSWDYKDPTSRAKGKKDAKFYSSRLEKMRDFFIQHYPLGPAGLRGIAPDPSTLPTPDGPVTGEKEAPPPTVAEPVEGKDKATYSIFRLCATYEQFQKYGKSPPGVVGWFSPASKELVVFRGGDKLMGKGATETVTYHEGWHQFADLYFSNPGGRDGNLHRWFDEGHGDFFGSYRPKGGGFSYKGSAMRHDSVKRMVKVGDYVPFKDIVTWNRRKFYGQNAAYYYAQAYSMIDYLRRGAKLKKHWKPRYDGILDMYRKVMLVYFDADRAVRTAFREFTDQDWKDLEEGWKAWVESSHFKDG